MKFVHLALSLGAVVQASAPPSPLGNGCLTAQYSNLNSASIVALPFDVSSTLDYRHPPSFLAMAQKEVSDAWKKFLASICNTSPVTGMEWAGQCRPFVSKLRDALNVYSAVYPNAGGQYSFDPWWVVQEDVAHRGYYLTGDYLDLFGLTGNDAQKSEKFNLIVGWVNAWRGAVGADGKKKISSSVTYDQYVRLSGPVCQDGSTPSDSQPCPYTTRSGLLDQFWGNEATAKPFLGAYENLGYLFKVVQGSALDGPSKAKDSRWNAVLSATDLTVNAGTAANPVYKIHDEFHELRKQVRAMWRNLQLHPEFMPATWVSLTVKGTEIGLWSWDDMKAKVIDGHEVLKGFFDNDAKHVGYFKSWGWSDELIWLGTTLALGGYYHQDLEGVSPSPTYIGSQMKFDLVERMGWINDELMTYKYGVAAGKDAAWVQAQRNKINGLWVPLKDWIVRNDLHSRLRDIADYIPATSCSGGAATSAAEALSSSSDFVLPLVVGSVICFILLGTVLTLCRRRASKANALGDLYMSLSTDGSINV